ncbi:unnamed protein product, partial [marine sediment metagenome]
FNKGILKFLIKLYMIGFRIKKFFAGVIGVAIPMFKYIGDLIAPIFTELGVIFDEIVISFDLILKELGIGNYLAGTASSKWEKVGKAIGWVIGIIVQAGVWLIKWFILPLL